MGSWHAMARMRWMTSAPMASLRQAIAAVPPATRRRVAKFDQVQRRHVWLAFPVAVVRKTANDQGGSLAALIAYYGFLSMFPLFLLFAAVLGFVFQGNATVKAHVLHTTEQSFPVATGYIHSLVSGSGIALGIGVVGVLWAGLGVARATERAMNAVWDIPMSERPNLWWSRVRALAMLGVLGATFLLSTALAALQQVSGPLALPSHAGGTIGPLVLNFGLYLMAFQVLTNRHLSWRSIVPGAAVGAVGWTAFQSLGAYFFSSEVAHARHLYGSLGTVLGLLVWIYLGALLTIYAAQVNVVLEYHLWPRSLVRGVHTDADRRSLMRQVREAQRSVDEVITMHFSLAHRDVGDGGGAAGQGGEHAAGPVAQREGPGATPTPVAGEQSDADADAYAHAHADAHADAGVLATHVAVAALVGHLEAYDAIRQQLESCREPGTADQLASRLDVEVDGITTALGRVVGREPDLAQAVRDAAR